MIGSVIQILSNILVGIEQEKRLISVSFTALVLNELVMVALEINTWHKYMIYAEVTTFIVYFLSIPFLGDYFGIYHLSITYILDLSYIITLSFIWKTLVILFISLGPPWTLKILRQRIKPPSYARIQES